MFNTLVANQRKSKYTTLLHMIEPNTLGIYTCCLSYVVTQLKFDPTRDESISTKCCWTNQISITLSWLSFKLDTSLRIRNPKNKNKVNLSLKRFEAYCWRTPTIQVFQLSRRRLMVQIMIYSKNELNQEDNRWGLHLQCQVLLPLCWWYPIVYSHIRVRYLDEYSKVLKGQSLKGLSHQWEAPQFPKAAIRSGFHSIGN